MADNITAGMTSAGLDLVVKSQLGKIVIFTKIKIGDGEITNENPAELNDLINTIDTLEIKSSEFIEDEDTGSASMKVTSLIKSAAEGYYFREMGLFAIDPDTHKEVLYAYVNKGSKPTYIHENNSPLAVEELASMVAAVGNTKNIAVNCNSELSIIENIEGGGGYSLFDTVLKDHILSFEESEGFALQGTFVYKEPIANERWGYSDFYELCLKERNEATVTTTVLGGTSVVTYNHVNGHIYYDIVNKSAIDAFYNTYGIAWFYGIDEENERIFLPRNNYFFKLSSSKTGGYNAPHIPSLLHTHSGSASSAGAHTHTRGSMNITGTIAASHQATGGTGAFSKNIASGSYIAPSTTSGSPGYCKFDASNSWTGSTSSNGAHGHSISVSSSDAAPSALRGNTVEPPSSSQLLYIVVGNVRQKSAVVINGELQDALISMDNEKESILRSIEDAKAAAKNDITDVKNSAVNSIEDVGANEIGLINGHVGEAQNYAQIAQQQAEIAGQYAQISVRGQVNSDFNENDPLKPSFILNKPDCDYENIVYLENEQTLSNKTINGLNNTFENIPFTAIAKEAKNTNITNINNVSDDDFPTSLAVYTAIDNKLDSNNIVGDGDIIDFTTERQTDVSVISSNPELIVESSYTETQGSNGIIVYNFTYTDEGWTDENKSIVSLNEYDLAITGTPEIGDIITLKYLTTSSSQIKANISKAGKSGSYNDLIEQPIFGQGLDVTNVLQTSVSIISTNESLTVKSSYSGTKDKSGVITDIFVYTSDGWTDNNGNIINLRDYDLTVTGTPEIEDVISVTYKTISRIKVSASEGSSSGGNSGNYIKENKTNIIEYFEFYMFDWSETENNFYEYKKEDIYGVFGVYKNENGRKVNVLNIDIEISDEGVILTSLEPFDGFIFGIKSENHSEEEGNQDDEFEEDEDDNEFSEEELEALIIKDFDEL